MVMKDFFSLRTFMCIGAVFMLSAWPAFPVLANTSAALEAAADAEWDDAYAQARRVGNNALTRVIVWKRLRDTGSTASFDEYATFIEQYPEWPAATIKRKAATAFLLSGANEDDVARYRKITEASGGRAELIKDAWVKAITTASEEDAILAKFGTDLSNDDHATRADNLVWNDRLSAAERLLPLLSSNDRNKIELRLALLRGESGSWSNASSEMKKDVGVQYARAYYLKKTKQEDALISLLKQTPNTLPEPDKWWDLRKGMVRNAIEDKNYSLAEDLLERHGQIDGESLAEALWFEGWMAYEFRDNPSRALSKFEQLYDAVATPVSKTRAAYWAGLAAKKSKGGSASSWFEKAAKYPLHFYGQMALYELNDKPKLSLPSDPSVSASDRSHFKSSTLAQSAKFLIGAGEWTQAEPLLNAYIDQADSDGKRLLAVELAEQTDMRFTKVRAAKRAQRGHTYVMDAGYPTIKLGFDPAIEPAFTHAITRQESEFRYDAKSSANAIGMMQLLPTTAQRTASGAGIPYSQSQLVSPPYNMKLGSIYMGKLVDGFDGSYILAICSYNAGPKRAREWVERFGMPGKSVEQTLRWLELIPFQETRNYVQRVLENMQVYRQVLAGSKDVPLGLKEDLLRGNSGADAVNTEGLY